MKQEFESTFFKMLELSREVAERVESKTLRDFRGAVSSNQLKLGAGALDSLAGGIARYAKEWFNTEPVKQAACLA